MDFVYIISFIFFLLIIILLICVLFRLRNTIVDAIINDVTCSSSTSKTCKLQVTYLVNNTSVTNSLTVENTGSWQKGGTIRIYINPKDLKQPKYISSVIYMICYLLITFFSLLLILIIVKWGIGTLSPTSTTSTTPILAGIEYIHAPPVQYAL